MRSLTGARWLSLALLILGVTSCQQSIPRGLVIITLDTVRRDHLPTYGYQRDTAPHIASLAEHSVVFWNAFAQDTNTNPSHASLFTGQYPHVHGNQINGQKLKADRVTLAGILKDAGFRTAAFVSGTAMKSSATGLDRGFEVYDDKFEGWRRDGADTIAVALDWLNRLASDEAFFLFVHLYDAHGPYEPQPPYRGLFQSEGRGPEVRHVGQYQRPAGSDKNAPVYLNDYVDRYDGLIRYMDDQVAIVLERLNLEEVIVLVMSDHGETLGERYHGLDHGAQVFDEQIRIPMILSLPGASPQRVLPMVETVHVLPTLLEVFGIPLPEGLSIQGRSMLPLMRGEAQGDPLVHSSARATTVRHADRHYQLRPNHRIHSIRSSRWKLILYPGRQHDYVELYDLEQDPSEKINRNADRSDERTKLLPSLRGWLELGRDEAVAPELDPDLREELRALGYIDEAVAE